MSDRIVEMHGVVCDWPGCGRVAQDEDTCARVWCDYEAALDYVQEWLDWAHIDGLDYCPEHHHYDYVDDDELSGPAVACALPGCGRVEYGGDGDWLHDGSGDWCPHHWRCDADGCPRPVTWFRDHGGGRHTPQAQRPKDHGI